MHTNTHTHTHTDFPKIFGEPAQGKWGCRWALASAPLAIHFWALSSQTVVIPCPSWVSHKALGHDSCPNIGSFVAFEVSALWTDCSLTDLLQVSSAPSPGVHPTASYSQGSLGLEGHPLEWVPIKSVLAGYLFSIPLAQRKLMHLYHIRVGVCAIVWLPCLPGDPVKSPPLEPPVGSGLQCSQALPSL